MEKQIVEVEAVIRVELTFPSMMVKMVDLLVDIDAWNHFEDFLFFGF
jgi:hypothetical protein